MTHLSNEVSRHSHAHNHTNIQKRESCILRTVFKFYLILTCSNGRFTFNEKNRNLIYVHSEYRVVLKAFLTIIMRIMLL